MWCLGKFLPLMIGNLIPEDDEKWQLFCTLLEIVDIVFSPVTSLDTIGVLEGLIEDHHLRFLDVYPGRSVLQRCTIWFVSPPICIGNFLLSNYEWICIHPVLFIYPSILVSVISKMKFCQLY